MLEEERDVDPAAIAGRVADSVAAVEVRGGFAMAVLRRALHWAIVRGSVGAREAGAREGWSSRANDGRLRAHTLRHVAWTLVLQDGEEGEHAKQERLPDAVARAASVIGAALAVRGELAEGSAGELLFGTTLIPGRDRFELHRAKRGDARHIVVGVSDSLWAIDVVDEAGLAHDEATLAASLRACLAAAKNARVSAPLVALSAASRADAAAVWPAVARDNPRSAALLKDAIFSVFFDPAAPADVDMTGRLSQGGPLTSRCFWHALQVVVFRNAKAALVGSFVAGVAADGALDIGQRLDGAKKRDARPGRSAKVSPPVPVTFDVDAATSKLLTAIGRGAAVNAGGFLSVPGFGRDVWRARAKRPASAEGAVVLALRLALEAAVPDLDDLECMVGLAHVHRGLVTRLGSTTGATRALVAAARTGPADANALAGPLAAALEVHRARVGAAKRRESAEVAFEYAVLVLGRRGALSRALVAAVARWVAVLVALRTPKERRRSLPMPLVAVDSSVPRPPGISAVGRFGVLAPPRSVWIHHSLADDGISFVLQLGPDQIVHLAALREAIPAALAQVLSAAAGDTSAAHDRPGDGDAPPTRVAYRRLLGLLAALQTRRPTA